MKIGIDARAAKWYRGTGIGTYTYQLAKNVCQLDKLNDYLLFFPDENLTDFEIEENVDIKNITDLKKENFWEEIDIPNLLSNTGIDIYLVPQNGIGLPLEKTCPFVITLHDVIPYRMEETVGPQYLKIFKNQVPEIIKRCDAIITVSEFSKKDIIDTFDFPKDKIFTTHLAAEDIYFPRNKIKCREFINFKYNINDRFILYVGGFSPRKNIKGLIKAFSMIKSSLPTSCKLVILGKRGRSYYEYRDYAISLNLKDDVIFTGYVPVNELPVFYNAAEIFCYPSFYEGFGLPPIEAMACGTPTIASNTTSIPEILEDAAIYIDPFSSSDIGEKLFDLLGNEDLKYSMYYKGLEQSNKYSWKKTGLETIEILKNIANGL
jgi:glycosyltransferase involved in cell wall biosynthesis